MIEAEAQEKPIEGTGKGRGRLRELFEAFVLILIILYILCLFYGRYYILFSLIPGINLGQILLWLLMPREEAAEQQNGEGSKVELRRHANLVLVADTPKGESSLAQSRPGVSKPLR